MFIICDECGDPTQPCQITTEPYIEGTLPHVAHLGTVKEYYICMDCAEEREWWRKQYGIDKDGNPGI